MHSVPQIDSLSGYEPSAAFVSHVPIHFARRFGLMGFFRPDAENTVTVAIADLEAWPAIDIVRRLLATKVVPLQAPRDDILSAINRGYQEFGGKASEVAVQLGGGSAPAGLAFAGDTQDLLDDASEPTIIKLVNSFLFDAIEARASDVHIHPYEHELVVRQRIDGVLFDALKIPKVHQEEVITRLKILGKMDIAEKRLPQDGRASVLVGDRQIDLRLSSLPTSHGERIVVRSQVTIPDGYTVIVGGLNRTGNKWDFTSVPFIDQIPLLRYLGGSESRNTNSTSMFVFLKPIILRDDKFRDLKYLSDRDSRSARNCPDVPTSQPVWMTIRA
jgi:type II secretory ATPase GspE/PulE/Tfp pilus assembly ATPase PilB-like protein